MDWAAFLANLILFTHAGVVVFVVVGVILIAVGGMRGWRWTRGLVFRLVHLLTVAFIALQAWLGELCPLTVWEQRLRERAGQPNYQESFIEHWLSELLFYEAPWWFFVTMYTVFAGLVALAWWRWPPRRRIDQR